MALFPGAIYAADALDLLGEFRGARARVGLLSGSVAARRLNDSVAEQALLLRSRGYPVRLLWKGSLT